LPVNRSSTQNDALVRRALSISTLLTEDRDQQAKNRTKDERHHSIPIFHLSFHLVLITKILSIIILNLNLFIGCLSVEKGTLKIRKEEERWRQEGRKGGRRKSERK
jgi:hypothetical protein